MAITILNKDKTPIDDLKSLHEWCRGLREDGLASRRAHEAQWWENIATFKGDLWVEFDPHTKQLYELPKADHRVRLPVNLAQPAVRTEYSKLLKNRPIANCIAKSNDKKDLDSAKVGDDLLEFYIEDEFHIPKVRRRALQWAFLCGEGGVFTDIDHTAMVRTEVPVTPDGTPVFTESEVRELQDVYRRRHQKMKTVMVQQSELVVEAVSPFQWVYDFSKTDTADAMWVIIDQIMDVDEIWRRWGVEIDNPPRLKISTYEARMFNKRGIPENRYPRRSNYQKLARVSRLYIKPGHRYFPDGAHIIFTDDEVIDGEPFPFAHGQLPLSTMGHIFDPTSQHSMSIVEQVKPIVLEISKTESQMIESRNLMANPPWIEFTQNRVEGEILNKPGIRLEINYVPGVPEPHPVQMPDLPTYVQNLPALLGEHVLEITGQNETAQGQVPPGARSGVAIAYLTEENDTKLGPTVQEWEEMNERFLWQILSNIAQFYDIPRTVLIRKRGSMPEVLNFYGAMLNGIRGLKVQAGSALPRSLAAKQQFTMDLYDRGLIRNPRTIMDMLEVGQGEVDEWERDLEQAEREQYKLAQGQRVPVMEWHNHQAHLYVIHGFMKSADWDELNYDQQQVYIEHEQDHQAQLRIQQQQMMQQQMMQGGGNTPTGVANGQNQLGPQGRYLSPDDMGAVAEAGAIQDSIQ